MDKTTTSAVRLSFSTQLPNHQLAWDSTSLGALKRCPRFYQYQILEGHVTRRENIHLRWGSEYNNAQVTYNTAKARGLSHDDAVVVGLRYAMDHTWDHALGRPWTSDEPTKTRETLIRSLIWYWTKFANDPCETVILATGEAAVEMPFRIDIDEASALTGEAYLLCGYLDRKVEFNGGRWTTDWKTTKYALDEKYFSAYTPNNQVSQYAFAGHVTDDVALRGVIIDAVQLGVTFARFQRAEIPRTAAQLEEWLRDSLHYIRQNEGYVRDNYWPQNDMACHLFGGCVYRGICSASPELRSRLLDGLFQQRKWDPLVIREI